MKTIISIAIGSFISINVFCQNTIPVDSVRAHVGESVTVCSKVYGIKSLDKVTFINLGAAYPQSPLTIVIFAKDMDYFKGSVASLYGDKDICVTGTIKEYKGKPEIVVSQPGEIKIQ